MTSNETSALLSTSIDLEIGLNEQVAAGDSLPLPAEIPGPRIKPFAAIDIVWWALGWLLLPITVPLSIPLLVMYRLVLSFLNVVLAFVQVIAVICCCCRGVSSPQYGFHDYIQWSPGWLLLPLSLPLLFSASVLSLPLKVMRNTTNFIIRGHSIRGISSYGLEEPLSDSNICLIYIPGYLFFGNWDKACEMSSRYDYPLFSYLLSWLPWPHSANDKIFAMAKYRATNGVRRWASIEDHENVYGSLAMLRRTDIYKGGVEGDENTLEVLKDCAGKGADLNYPDCLGRTVLWRACYHHHHKCIQWLLSQGADPNIRNFEDGSTAMHAALFLHIDLGTVTNFPGSHRRRTIDLLRHHEPLANNPFNPLNYADFSIVDKQNRTPYMSCKGVLETFRPRPWWAGDASDDELKYCIDALEALRPRPSWQECEEVLCRDGLSNLQVCNDLLNLIAQYRIFPQSNPRGSQAVRHLRIFDMLFCQHEGNYEELTRRRNLVFERFLKPALLRSVKEPKIEGYVKELLRHVFDQTGHSPKLDGVMMECTELIEKLYGEEFSRLLAEDPDIENLMSFPKVSSKLNIEDLTHAKFMKKPWWAKKKDLPAAIRALQQVGVIESAHAFCDLIQFGLHRLLPISDPKFFKDGPESQTFWIALVLLWSIGIHEKIQVNFNKDMKAEAGGAIYKEAPGVKAFPRSFEKAIEYKNQKCMREWEDLVYAGLHVIDGLRCSFSVDTAKENIALGRRLEAKFPVVRTKNGHLPGNTSYADRKYNLVYKTTAKDIGEVAVICEIQILMKRYIDIKKVGHLLYEFQR